MMNKIVAMMAIMVSGVCYAQDGGQISVKMSAEVKAIASVVEKWQDAWGNDDKETFLGLTRAEDPKMAENMFRMGKQVFAYDKDRPDKCLIVSRAMQKPSAAVVHLYPISAPNQQAGFKVMMSKQEGKWYVQAVGGIEVNDIATHYQKWADENEEYEIWYDTDSPQWLKPGQKESEVAKKIAAINVKDRKLYQESYGPLLGDIRIELSEGSRLQKSQLFKVIRSKRLSGLFDESFVGPLRSCLKSEDVETAKLARGMYDQLKKKIRRKLEADASKVPDSPQEFKALADKYNNRVSRLNKGLAQYRSKKIFRDFKNALEKEVFPLIHKGRIANQQKGEIRKLDPDAYKKSTFNEKESRTAIVDIVAAALKDIHGKFGRAVEEGVLRPPDDEQNKIFYFSILPEFQARKGLIKKPYEKHCPFKQGTMEYCQFMNTVGQTCVMSSAPLMVMVKQLPDKLEDAKEEVKIMHKWLEAGKGSKGEAIMPEPYKEPYLNEIDELAIKEGIYENKGK